MKQMDKIKVVSNKSTCLPYARESLRNDRMMNVSGMIRKPTQAKASIHHNLSQN